MRTVTAADANRYFSKLLKDVKGGETVVVTSHGQPVARIEPVPCDVVEKARRAEAMRELLEHLRSQPALNLGRITRDEIYDD